MPTILPNLLNGDLEVALIGSLVINPDAIAPVAEHVQPEDFQQYRWVYEVIRDLDADGMAVDFLTICDALTSRGQLDELGGAAKISSIINSVPSAVHAITYAVRLKRLALLRKFVELSTVVVRKAHEGQTAPDDLFAFIEENLQHIRGRQIDNSDGLLYGADYMPWYEDVLQRRIHDREAGTLRLYDWPWQSWNNLIRPARAGTVAVLVGPDGSGKSTYLDMIAEHWAKQGHNVLLVHLEDDTEYKADRRTARWAGIPLADAETGNLTATQLAEWRRVEGAIAAAWGANLTYKHAPGATLRDILSLAEMERRAGRCDALVVDYLTKIQLDPDIARQTRDDNRRDAQMMERIKTFAERAGIPIFIAGQITKEGKSAGREATRNAIRGTGEISDKSQLVITISREKAGADGITDANGRKIAGDGEYSPLIELSIDKQNRGKTARFRQWFDGPRFRILDLTPRSAV